MAPQEFYESLLHDPWFTFLSFVVPTLSRVGGNIIFCFSYTNFHTKLTSSQLLTIIFKNLNLQILLKLNLLLYKILVSVEQYSSSRNHLPNNPHVKMPSKIGYFHEIVTLQ